MNKKIIYLSVMLFSAISFAQVKIGGTDGTPNKDAMLEIQSDNKGMLLPRVALTSLTSPAPLAEHVSGMVVYNTATGTGITPGLYHNNGVSWAKLVNENYGSVKFFYMPSIVFNTTTIAPAQKRNLYAEYKAQFTNKVFIPNPATGGAVGTAVRPTFVKSTNAPDTIPNLPLATDLYYYVTDYDTTALANLSIDANGILTYDIIGTGTPYSFVNIVFVVK